MGTGSLSSDRFETDSVKESEGNREAVLEKNSFAVKNGRRNSLASRILAVQHVRRHDYKNAMRRLKSGPPCPDFNSISVFERPGRKTRKLAVNEPTGTQ